VGDFDETTFYTETYGVEPESIDGTAFHWATSSTSARLVRAANRERNPDRTCQKCGATYAYGTYRAHCRTPEHEAALGPTASERVRTCTRCGQDYPTGTYKAHARQVHIAHIQCGTCGGFYPVGSFPVHRTSTQHFNAEAYAELQRGEA
jgi:hypothetical protein